MKNLISILFLLISGLIYAQTGQIRPITVKQLQTPNNITHYFNQGDTAYWIRMGSYGDLKIATDTVLKRDYVPYKGAYRNVDLDTMSLKTGFIDFAQRENPYRGAYRLFVDTTAHTLGFYNDETDITLQVGQEMWTRIFNNSGGDILNGTVVRITGSYNGIATVDLASNDNHLTSDGVLGVMTHDVEGNTYGFVTTIGEVHGLPTLSCPEGGIIYLGSNGQYTHTRPLAPNFVVEIGTCLYSHATDGTILVNIKGSPYDIVHNSFNDIFLESMVFKVTSNGTTTIGTIERKGGGDLTMQFSDGFTTLDCTPARTITLTPGTATVPQTNYVYVLRSTKDLAVSTTSWPAEEHIKIAEVACRTSALTQSDGVLRNQNWNDHISGDNGSGHISHINERIRRLNADWYSGVAPSFIIVSAANPDNLYFSNTGGKVYQMHLQDFPAQSMPTDDIHIVNHFTVPYTTVTNLNTQLTDAVGTSLVNRSYSLVIWGIQNETGELSHLMCNLPIGSYSSLDNATKDADNYSVYTIPNQFKGVGFLIARVTLAHSSANSGTWTLGQVQDLRGYVPNNTAGSGAAGTGGGVETYLQLLDTPNSYIGASNKLQGVNSGETAIEHKNITATVDGTLNIPTGQQYQINGGSIIVDAINNGVTTTASSQNAVFDALALKEPVLTKGTLTEAVDGLVLTDSTRQVIGGATQLQLKTGRFIPTLTQKQRWDSAYTQSKEPVFSIEDTTQTSIIANVEYGALYNWYAATDSRKISSSDDWVVPSQAQYILLHNYLGNESVAGGKLKESGIIHWDSPNTDATNETGFSARGAGSRSPTSGLFNNIKVVCDLWSTTLSGTNGLAMQLSKYDGSSLIGGRLKEHGGTIRLLYTGAGTPTTYTGNDGKVYDVVLIGSQYWLSENLNETKFRNGDWINGYNGGVYTPISNAAWAALTTDGMCYYSDLETNGGTITTQNLVNEVMRGDTIQLSLSIYKLKSDSVNADGYVTVNRYEKGLAGKLDTLNLGGIEPRLAIIQPDGSIDTLSNDLGYLYNNGIGDFVYQSVVSDGGNQSATFDPTTRIFSIIDNFGTVSDTIPTASEVKDGLLSKEDKEKLNGISIGAEPNVNADWNATSGDTQILNKPAIMNLSVQSLSGTTPSWNVTNGVNATITLSGNTTVTFSNLVAGYTGNLTVTNAFTAYTLTFAGYTVYISQSVWSTGDTALTSGSSAIDSYSWYYDGSAVYINGTLTYK